MFFAQGNKVSSTRATIDADNAVPAHPCCQYLLSFTVLWSSTGHNDYTY